MRDTAIVVVLLSAALLSGCALPVLIAGGWLMQGAPGVLTESQGQFEDKQVRGLTSSHVVSVQGRGWSKKPAAPSKSYTFSAIYSESGRGLFLSAMVRNGRSGKSQTGALLAELYVSNNDAHSYGWFSKENWTKEDFILDPQQVVYAYDSLRVRPVAAEGCADWTYRSIPVPSGPQATKVAAGAGQCVRLVFPTDIPPSDRQFTLDISGITLGTTQVPAVAINFDRLPD